MSEPTTSRNDVALEASIPEGGASLESILCTEELQRRPSRAPDYEKENSALVKLVSALADSPDTVLQTLAETILHITQCDSAGLSLLTRDGKTPDVCGQRFYWPAIAGMWKPHIGKGTPRNFGPCGDVLDQNRTLLFKHFERRYPYFEPVTPVIEECLLVPFYVAGEAVGTIWAIMHSERRKFDAEDDRVMASLGKFASSAYQTLLHTDDLKIQVAEGERAEAEVRELARGLETKIRRLVEANVVGIVMWNLEGEITEANEAFLQMVQYNREEVATGRVRWTDLTSAEWRDRDQQAITELKTTGVFQPFEKEYFRKDGSRVPVLVGGASFEAGGNEGVAIVLDLTEQKRAEEERERLRQAQRIVVETATDAVVSADESGAIQFANPATMRVFGYDPRELIGKPLTVLMPEYLRKLHENSFRRYLATGQRHLNWEGTELTGLRKNGQEFPVEVSFGELTMDEHRVFTGFIRDISERKQAEEERERLRQAQADLAHINRVHTMGELTASLAHELKQPLFAAETDATTCLRWLGRDQPGVAQAQEAASRFMKDVTHGSEILSRIGSLFKKGIPQREVVDVNELIREMMALLRSEATRYSVLITTALANDLPRILADRVGLQQVLMNLMLNGIEAMKDMGSPGTLTIKSQRDEDHQILVSVSDTGVGLRPGQEKQIFNAFVTSKPGGTGMGLPISRSIIESHGGRLWPAFDSGPGATFRFTLPIPVIAGQAA